MDALFAALADVIRALFTDQRNMALAVSFAFNCALVWAHVVWRREEREDRKASTAAYAQVTEAMNAVKNALAALVGRVV